ncbi:MAG: hypothetical protein CVV21_08840 [Candidatus Goldiibacteriota bacterium HGW-Goldbacteria-1]|nr:MAG: hypothetical protein CVV21_08840 [Candidatus Goldiibacteriota bacterium HGW-Goldbacteria-1]
METDNHLSLEDIQEIFGSVMQVIEPAKPAAAVMPAEKEKPAAILEQPYVQENNTDDFMKRAKELEKEFAKQTEAAQPVSGFGFYGETEKAAMIKMYEEISAELRNILMSSISEKAVNNMMLRSLEKIALMHPVMKNTNWDSDGRLKEDGSVDFERFIKNIQQFGNENIEKAFSAMMELLAMRLKAIKTGTGVENYKKAAAAINKKLMIIEAGYPKAVSVTVRNKVVEAAIKKAEV